MKALKSQNFKLIEKLFAYENFQIESFDKAFNQFLSRAVHLNYEITKKFLTRERENNETMTASILKKDEELIGLRNKVALLEQVFNAAIFALKF